MNKMQLFSRSVTVATIPPAGIVEEIVATDAERAAIAAELGLVAVAALAAEVTVGRAASDMVLIDGRVRARIVQNCVVSLVPVSQEIDEPIHVRLVDSASDKAPPPPRPGAEILVGGEPVEPPDTYSGPTIDIGMIALEHFALAIDPYPRAPGAELEAPADAPPAAGTSPFAVLAGLAARKS